MILGPVTFLKLAKTRMARLIRFLAAALLPVYIDMLRRLAANGADWVQLDEPCLVLDLDARSASRCGKPMSRSPGLSRS